jgi:hypothetical protein
MRSLLRSKLIWGLLLGLVSGPFVGLLFNPACGTGMMIDLGLGGAIGLAVGFCLDALASNQSVPMTRSRTGD